jgi:signal peptidase I
VAFFGVVAGVLSTFSDENRYSRNWFLWLSLRQHKSDAKESVPGLHAMHAAHTMSRMPEERNGSFQEILTFALIALAVVIPIRVFIAQPFIVHGASMEPTFETGEYLIVDQLTYHFESPQRGDVIIMRYPKDPSTFFIKRIIGLPGETVELAGKNVIIHPADGSAPFPLDESFLDPARVGDQYATFTLTDSQYFVMGDNRVESSDSRSWGPLPAGDVVGRAMLRLFPLNRISAFPGSVSLPQ